MTLSSGDGSGDSDDPLDSLHGDTVQVTAGPSSPQPGPSKRSQSPVKQRSASPKKRRKAESISNGQSRSASPIKGANSSGDHAPTPPTTAASLQAAVEQHPNHGSTTLLPMQDAGEAVTNEGTLGGEEKVAGIREALNQPPSPPTTSRLRAVETDNTEGRAEFLSLDIPLPLANSNDDTHDGSSDPRGDGDGEIRSAREVEDVQTDPVESDRPTPFSEAMDVDSTPTPAPDAQTGSSIPPSSPPVSGMSSPAPGTVKAKARPKAKSTKEKEGKKTAASKLVKESKKKTTPKGAQKKGSAKKEKTKVQFLKESNRSRVDSPSSDLTGNDSEDASRATTPHQAESVDSNDDAVYCICRKPYKDEAEDVIMVACDGCDNWFHPGCVGIKEDMLDLLDAYICAQCEQSTTLRTTYKRVCKRGPCDKSLKSTDVKYCSSSCAFQHMAEQVPPTTNKKLLKQLSTMFVGLPAPETTFSITHHLGSSHMSRSPSSRDPIESSTLESLSRQLKEIDKALTIVTKRQEILRSAMARYEALPMVAVPQNEAEGKKKRSGAGEDRACGWDKRLIWSDEEVDAAIDLSNDVPPTAGVDSTTETEVDADVCMLPRRRCDRHSGWQKVLPASLEVETAGLAQRKEIIQEYQINSSKSLELEKATRSLLDAFHQRLSSSKVSRGL